MIKLLMFSFCHTDVYDVGTPVNCLSLYLHELCVWGSEWKCKFISYISLVVYLFFRIHQNGKFGA